MGRAALASWWPGRGGAPGSGRGRAGCGCCAPPPGGRASSRLPAPPRSLPPAAAPRRSPLLIVDCSEKIFILSWTEKNV